VRLSTALLLHLVLLNPAGLTVAAGEQQQETGTTVILENNGIKVSINARTGCFDVLEKQTGTLWGHDPWEGIAGELRLRHRLQNQLLTLALGKQSQTRIRRTDRNAISMTFDVFTTQEGNPVQGVSVSTCLALHSDRPELRIEVNQVETGSDWNYSP